MNTFTLGTRGSALALAQAELTRAALRRAFPHLNVVQKVFITRGDQKLDLNLARAGEAGGKGLFTRELEEALLDGSIDAAVHSLKDLPGQNPAGLTVTAVLERAATADVLITREPFRIDTLPQNAVIGTSSVRRSRQLRWLRPDLVVQEWRGNVQTRLRKLGEALHTDGIVLAQAGLERLGFRLWPQQAKLAAADPNMSAGSFDEGPESTWREFAQRRARVPGSNGFGSLDFPPWTFHVSSLSGHLLPAIGQGAIALQSRADREEVSAVLARIDHAETHLAIRAERALQAMLEGDCAMPIGVRTSIASDQLTMRAILFTEEESAPRTAEAQGAVHAPEAVAAEIFAALAPAPK